MSYVFTPPPPSERAQRLARHLSAAVDEFRRRDPGLTGREIHQALGLVAREKEAAAVSNTVALVVAVLLVLGLVAFLFFAGER